jgi:hypothetical protein
MAEVFEHREIGNQIADGNSGALFASLWLKDAKRKIFYGKMRVRRNFDERFESHGRDAVPQARDPDSAARCPYPTTN